MENFLKEPIKVNFNELYLDPNNPRLASENAPGYDDAEKLFDPDLQSEAEHTLLEIYNPDDLIRSITTQGWMPIDNIVVWSHPDKPHFHVVVEGNTRTLALRKIRNGILTEARDKLKKMEDRPKKFASSDIEEQAKYVAGLERLLRDTEIITVVPLNADSVEELERKLPRVLAVRHIQGSKAWGGYAEDIWVYERYKHLFESKFPGEPIGWEKGLIQVVANESSSKWTTTKKKMMAARSFSQFTMNYEEHLPEGEALKPNDYYLFEIIAKNNWLSEQFGLTENELHLSPEGEKALFEWVFKKPRTGKGDTNENIIYRHENIRDWASMRRYDLDHGTNFSHRLDVLSPETAPTYKSIEAAWLAHKARKQPQEVIDELIQKLSKIDTTTLFNSGEALKDQLKRIRTLTDQCIKAIEANEINK
ncbi:hypothetical protein, partial [Pontibacter rugosus]